MKKKEQNNCCLSFNDSSIIEPCPGRESMQTVSAWLKYHKITFPTVCVILRSCSCISTSEKIPEEIEYCSCLAYLILRFFKKIFLFWKLQLLHFPCPPHKPTSTPLLLLFLILDLFLLVVITCNKFLSLNK